MITINQAPYGSIYYTEGLRAAVGTTSGIDEHKVNVIYLGDGVYFTLKEVNRNDTENYIATLKKADSKMLVEKESLAERNIEEGNIASDIEIISRSEVLSLIKEVDLTIDF
ncbi:MAG: Protein TusC [Candidatus Scalindua rubra]|uniref:Protein TusC n=1 Tax=Candidatus Scalindua rubra TaxID=1872076 RepID=A0A1E3XAI5_9BACT|nr:MAG: Protein TusC [Candidatus Scalindua rubra]